VWNIKGIIAPIVTGSVGATNNSLDGPSSKPPEKSRYPKSQQRQYLATPTSYERCSISQSPEKTARSEKNTYLSTRIEKEKG